MEYESTPIGIINDDAVLSSFQDKADVDTCSLSLTSIAVIEGIDTASGLTTIYFNNLLGNSPLSTKYFDIT